jgi:hypothetical protein
MNSRKDFFLFIGATILLLAGVTAWGLLSQGWATQLVKPLLPEEEARQVAIPELTLAPKGGDYPASPRASLKDVVNDWLAPEENEDDWNYDLFTTIDIAWDPAQSEYVPLQRRIVPLPPFGLTLVKVGHPTYPYVLSSTMTPRTGKEADREFLIQNIETKTYYERCKLKQPLEPKLAVTPVAFKVEKSADGFPRNVLTLDDKVLGRLVEIDDIKPIEFKDTVNILLAASDNPSTTWARHRKGDKFSYKGADFVIKDIDLANKTVTVDKTFVPDPKKGLRKTFTEVLSIPVEVKPTTPSKDKAKK